MPEAHTVSVLHQALNYAQHRKWHVFPADISGKNKKSHKSAKHSDGKLWGMTRNAEEIKKDFSKWPDAIGIPTGAINGIFVLEIDTKKGHGNLKEDGTVALAALEAKYGALPKTLMAKSPSGSIHYYFRHPNADGSAKLKVRNTSGELGTGIDTRGDGGMVVAPPSKRHDGIYEWLNVLDPMPAPEWLLHRICENAEKKSNGHDDGTHAKIENDLLATVLRAVPNPDIADWEYFNRIGMAVFVASGGSREGLSLYHEWCQKASSVYNQRATDEKWQKFVDCPPTNISAGTLFFLADEHDPNWRKGLKQPKKPKLRFRSLYPIIEEAIPTRPWIIPGLILRKHLTVLAAPPGSAKSTLSMMIPVTLVTKLDWFGWRPRNKCRCLIINTEEDMEELHRRAVAVAASLQVPQEVLADQIIVAENPQDLVIAKFDRASRSMTRQPLVDELIAFIKDGNFDFVSVDPFAETFEGDETNVELKWTAILWREIARATNTGIWLNHHTPKYAATNGLAGSLDALRGGGSFGGVVRFAATMFGMTAEEAVLNNVVVEDRQYYIRFDDAKVQYDVKNPEPRWFKLGTRTLLNQHDDVAGDNVGVLEPWTPVQAASGDDLENILMQIDKGIVDNAGTFIGEYFTLNDRIKAGDKRNRWVGLLLQHKLDCEEEVAKRVLREWVKQRKLVEFVYRSKETRKMVKGCGSPGKKRQIEQAEYTIKSQEELEV